MRLHRYCWLAIVFVVVAACPFVDWYAWGEAVPPTPDPLVPGVAEPIEFLIDGENALKGQVNGRSGDTVRVRCTFKTEVKNWRWSSLSKGLSFRALLADAPKYSHLPAMEVRFVTRSRSYLYPGHVINGLSLGKEEIVNSHEVRVTGDLDIPVRTGVFEVLVVICKRSFRRAVAVPDPEIIVGRAHLLVTEEP